MPGLWPVATSLRVMELEFCKIKRIYTVENKESAFDYDIRSNKGYIMN